MHGMKFIAYLILFSCLALSILINNAQSQEGTVTIYDPTQQTTNTQVTKKDEEILLREKHSQEIKELKEKQRKEKEEAREKARQARKQDRERIKKEKQEAKEKKEVDKTKNKSLENKINEETKKNKEIAKLQIKERKEEIKKAKRSDRLVEILTNENDPLYIKEAEVLNSKTNFLKIKGIELKYRLVLTNQTPKIINKALIIWERKKPFEQASTITRETQISKPIVPYEKRTIEYNDINTERQGELYKVKITHIVFEDGSQWKNPL